ncbi:MAG TPA: hypothetical protein PL124_12080 [Candidatus Cloacimonadota bacterium]|nr:hypothetical protein [Candidatus Cloacimonadota bacterium]HPS40148.1 hypothetical protein [Candidatus Cloacimonadota bacterium]
MNLFVDKAPVIVAGTTTHQLVNYANCEYNYDEHDFILHTSKLTGKRTLISKGTYFSAQMTLRGLTYSLYTALRALRVGTAVTFYPYGQSNITIGGSVYTAPSITVLITKAAFFHLNNTLWRDGLLLEMASEGYYELTLTSAGT